MAHFKNLKIKTDGTGAATARVYVGGKFLRVIDVILGDLSTPDIDITAEPAGDSILSVNGVAADTRYYPNAEGTDGDGAAISGSVVPLFVSADVQVVISGGGAGTSGTVRLVFE